MNSLVVLLLIVGLYFLPTIVAWNRKVPSIGSVAVINLLLGWTLIGWVVALAMSARTVSVADRLAELKAQGELERLEEEYRQLQEWEAGQGLLAELDRRPRKP